MGNLQFSGNQIKLLALITMTADHIGLLLFDDCLPLRIIGRISFPLYAFMIAEGCRYTRRKLRYFLQLFLLGIVCQTVFFLAEKSLYQGIFITFSLSVLMIYSVQWAKQRKNRAAWLLPAAVIGCFFCSYRLLLFALRGTNFGIDYGFTGAVLPLLISLSENQKRQRLLAAVGLFLLCLAIGDYQWYSLFALVPLSFYSGRRGTWNLKYFFYLYYPLHLAVIYALSLLFLE